MPKSVSKTDVSLFQYEAGGKESIGGAQVERMSPQISNTQSTRKGFFSLIRISDSDTLLLSRDYIERRNGKNAKCLGLFCSNPFYDTRGLKRRSDSYLSKFHNQNTRLKNPLVG